MGDHGGERMSEGENEEEESSPGRGVWPTPKS
jgi:hypothetical protein